MKNMTANKRNKKWILFPLLLVSYEIILYLSNDAYLPALPKIANQFHVTNGLAQLTLTLWFLGSASMQLILGPLSEKYGRKKIILSGGLVFLLVTFACAYTNNIHLLILCRFLQGATVISMVVPGYAAIHESFEQEKAIHILALMSSCTILAPSFGPLLGSVLLQFMNWQGIFILLGCLALIPLIGLAFKMPETATQIGEPLGLKTIFRQYANILTNRQFMMYSLAGQCMFAAMIAWITAGPFLVINTFKYSELGFGLSQLCIFGSFIVGTKMLKALMAKYKPHFIARVGFVLTLCGSLYLCIAGYFYPGIYTNLVIGMMIIAFGTGILYPVTQRLSVESSQEPMGAKMAISSLLTGCASVLGSFVMSASNDSFLSLARFLFILCVAAILFKWLTKHQQH